MSQLAAERYLAQTGPVDAETAAALESGTAVPWNPPADTAAIIAADAAVAQEAALSGLQGVVATWQQELMAFREVWVSPSDRLMQSFLLTTPKHCIDVTVWHAWARRRCESAWLHLKRIRSAMPVVVSIIASWTDQSTLLVVTCTGA